MGLVIIFALVALLGAYATLRTLKEKNMLGLVFSFLTFAIFGWFSVMTVLNSGYPPAH
ncbi:DUF2759 domain-containing protein [Ectobacillus ponti]|uniref:DUF2759 domain-containing protein n=1 Tax=Ectobacillus ponti TaxID=2961894 RepID=A0AA41X199_9BACI|nr:DUF2759 domain-containing protein [Ectobacillus ponti]MCP8967124.1 DUF2759 domain-containing protein [Ectobacillus ponti]